MADDWTLSDAKAYSKALRENGIKARAVSRKNHDSYAKIYYKGKDDLALAKKILSNLEDQGILPYVYYEKDV
ncbi:hypothetical protein QX249_11170 [Vibrio parahaemolyticus]|uniref:SPOR domain-containing protein n=1 Tax=Vibrio parahaemolyticus TaxID=670 RepID=A0AAW8Q0P4_VIBPH|nr:hypothetical protein [Vibrio parahaemolyticus]MDS1821224.1 hypothetical protein [Vibrio parahaemolyticus]